MVFLAVVALNGSQGGSTADNLIDSGNGFLSACDSSDTSGNPLQKGLCLGYVSGVTDGISLAEKLTHKPSSCLPATVTNGQVLDIVVTFVRDHPELRHWQTRWLIQRSLLEAFPCQAQKSK
jgi:hypothetical protein